LRNRSARASLRAKRTAGDDQGLKLGNRRHAAKVAALSFDVCLAVLVEPIAMYERAGYRDIERYNDNPHAKRWFAQVSRVRQCLEMVRPELLSEVFDEARLALGIVACLRDPPGLGGAQSGRWVEHAGADRHVVVSLNDSPEQR
jgi:hypothetical protein